MDHHRAVRVACLLCSCQVNWHVRAFQMSTSSGGAPGPVLRLPLYDGTYLAYSTLGVGSIPPTLLGSQAAQRRGPPITFSCLPLRRIWTIQPGPGSLSRHFVPLRLSVHMRAFTPLGVPRLVGWHPSATQPVQPPSHGKGQGHSHFSPYGNSLFPLRFMAYAGPRLSGCSPPTTKYHGAPPWDYSALCHPR